MVKGLDLAFSLVPIIENQFQGIDTKCPKIKVPVLMEQFKKIFLILKRFSKPYNRIMGSLKDVTLINGMF